MIHVIAGSHAHCALNRGGPDAARLPGQLTAVILPAFIEEALAQQWLEYRP